MAKGCSALLRYAERTFVAALRNKATIKKGRAREVHIRQAIGRLSRNSLIEINTRLDALQDFVNRADSHDARTTYVITICLAPVVGGNE